MRLMIACLFSALLAAAPVVAKPPLSQVSSINDGLLAVGIADVIRKRCDTISGRLWKGLGYLNSLKRSARSMGYTDEEIDAYVSSKEEEAKIKARGEAYLAERGASTGDPASLCKVGYAEIASGSRIGSFLKAK